MVADIGGGAKPFRDVFIDIPLSNEKYTYEGLDICFDQLIKAESSYDAIYQLDLTNDSLPTSRRYDWVFCLNTLEHVKDAEKSLANACGMIKDGGVLYLKVPCRFALFAQVNRLLPEVFKTRLLHFIFPEKIGDGFPAYYDKCSVSEFEHIITSQGFRIVDRHLITWSSYFTFFFPLYVGWRIINSIRRTYLNELCESFEIRAIKANRFE